MVVVQFVHIAEAPKTKLLIVIEKVIFVLHVEKSLLLMVQ